MKGKAKVLLVGEGFGRLKGRGKEKGTDDGLEGRLEREAKLIVDKSFVGGRTKIKKIG